MIDRRLERKRLLIEVRNLFHFVIHSQSSKKFYDQSKILQHFHKLRCQPIIGQNKIIYISKKIILGPTTTQNKGGVKDFVVPQSPIKKICYPQHLNAQIESFKWSLITKQKSSTTNKLKILERIKNINKDPRTINYLEE